MLPAKFGGQQTIAAFNNELGKHVDLICLCSSDNIPEGNESYKIIPELPVSKWQFINPLTWKKIVAIARKEQITHIIIEHPYHAIAGWLCKKQLGCKIIHYSHNIEYRRFKQLSKWYWNIVKKEEFWLSRFADLNICVTKEDEEVLVNEANISRDKIFYLPHTISNKNISGKTEARRLIAHRHGLDLNRPLLLFNGTLDYEPNYEAVMDICKLVPVLKSQLEKFTILITGRCKTVEINIPAEISEYVKYAGEVADVGNYFLAADIYINPVKKGEGVQTKTLEALSYHLNVVCYQHMLRGIIVYLVKDRLFIAGNSTEFITCIVESLKTQGPTSNAFFSFYSYEHHFPLFLNKLKQL